MRRELTVVSLNVCTGLRNDLAPLRERAGTLGRAVTGAGAEAVLLQEVWTLGALRAMTRSLPSLPYVAWRRGPFGGPAGGLAICSREPLRPARFARFRGARARRGSPAFRLRVAAGNGLRGVLTARRATDGVLLATTQLTSNREGDWTTGNRHHLLQQEQLMRLHAALPGPAERPRAPRSDLGEPPRTPGRGTGPVPPHVLGGDFNVAADTALYPAVTGHGAWRDSFAGDPRPTFRVECLPPGSVAHRIDYILVRADPDRHPVTRTDLLLTGPDLYTDHAAPLIRLGIG